MKKLVVLALLLAAGMLWAQAAAPAGPTFTMGLRLDYEWAQDFGAGKEYSDRMNIELKFNWVADEFTTAYFELEEGPLGSQGDTAQATVTPAANGIITTTGSTADQGGYYNAKRTTLADQGYDNKIAGVDKAYFTTNVGKFFKLPIPVSVMYGFNEWNNKDFIKVTKSEFEDFLGEADIRNWGGQIEVTPSPMVTFRSNWSWNSGAVGTDKPMFLIGAYGTVAPISYEVTYFTHNQDFDKGWIEGGVKFVQDMTKDINLAACFSAEYDMEDNPPFAYYYTNGGDSVVPNPAYLLQAGVQVMFQKMVALGVSYAGAEDMLAGGWQIQGYLTPKAGDPLELFAQLGLGLDSDVFVETFDSLEVAARYTMGKVQWYLGFDYAVDQNRNLAKEWADFDIAGAKFRSGAPGLETAAIFMRGNLNF